MKLSKKKISDLTLCYCVAPLTYQGKEHFLVASEKEHPCYLFDVDGNKLDTIWEGPGGTMSAVQIPGVDGAFLATHMFYSPNNSKEAKIVLVWNNGEKWKVNTVAELPYVHRFDILSRNGINYLIACCIKSDYEYKDDWRFPGMTLVCQLPTDITTLTEGEQLELVVLKNNMLKNHGYCRSISNGIMTGIVTCDNGIFRFTPPAAKGKEWEIEELTSDGASDAIDIDFDGCGTPELLTFSPFHGDTLCVYKKRDSRYEKIWEYEKKLEFLHAICRGESNGKHIAIIGHRKGDRDLLAVSYEGGKYKVSVLDHDVGPANTMFMTANGKGIIVSANREINEVAYYSMEGE